MDQYTPKKTQRYVRDSCPTKYVVDLKMYFLYFHGVYNQKMFYFYFFTLLTGKYHFAGEKFHFFPRHQLFFIFGQIFQISAIIAQYYRKITENHGHFEAKYLGNE